MEWLQSIYNVVVYANLWVAAGAASMYWATALLMGRHPDLRLGCAIFLATISVYTFQRVFRANRIYTLAPSERHRWILHHLKALWGLCILSGLMAAVLFYSYIGIWGWEIPSVLVAIAVLYVTPLIPRQGKWLRLRDLPGLKIWLIAGVWTVFTVFTVSGFPTGIWERDVFLVLSRFLFLFAITLPFDIRDLEHDRANGVRTYAVWLGLERTLTLSRSLLVAFAAIAVMAYWNAWIGPGQAGALIYSAASTGWLIAKIDEEAPEWMYAFWLEGTMLDQWFWLYLCGNYWP